MDVRLQGQVTSPRFTIDVSTPRRAVREEPRSRTRSRSRSPGTLEAQVRQRSPRPLDIIEQPLRAPELSAEKTTSSPIGKPSFTSKLIVPKKKIHAILPTRTLISFKYSFLALNSISLTLGTILIALSISGFLETFYFTSIGMCLFLLFLGFLTTLISFIGLIGAVSEKESILRLFFWLDLFAFLTQVGFFIFVIVEFDNGIIHALGKLWRSSENEFRLDFQRNFKCCGFVVAADKPGVPCPETTRACGFLIEDWIESRYPALGVSIGILYLFQLAVLALALKLTSLHRRTNQVSWE